MIWKDWPYWLKGGFITGIIFLIIYLVLPQFLFYLIPFTSLGMLHLSLISILSSIMNIEPGLNVLMISVWIGLGLDFLLWILIGIFIGWIYGKIRSKWIAKAL